jgi:hypothetical protein
MSQGPLTGAARGSLSLVPQDAGHLPRRRSVGPRPGHRDPVVRPLLPGGQHRYGVRRPHNVSSRTSRSHEASQCAANSFDDLASGTEARLQDIVADSRDTCDGDGPEFSSPTVHREAVGIPCMAGSGDGRGHTAALFLGSAGKPTCHRSTHLGRTSRNRYCALRPWKRLPSGSQSSTLCCVGRLGASPQ